MAFRPDMSFPPLDPLDASPLLAEPHDERVTPLPQGPFADRYEVIRDLGAGGMGVVHLAYDRRACRNVALKRIRRSFAGSVERFRREYRALAAIRHRGVPAIYDIGETAAGEPYFTMEVISGETIRAHLRRGPIEPRRALALAIDLGRVLAAVHEAGVIHRDVKPDNVIIEAGDHVRLIDFGAALLTEDYYSQPHLRDPTDVRKRWRTRESEFIGAVAYTCPLWLNEGKVSPQTDVFSVCVLLYEMITHRALYSRETYQHREIRPEEFAPELAPLVTELQRGASMIGAERHRTMEDLVRALEIVRSDLVARATRPSPRWWMSAVAAASAGSFVLGAVAAGSVLLSMPASTPPAATAEVLPSSNAPLRPPDDAGPAPQPPPAAEPPATAPTPVADKSQPSTSAPPRGQPPESSPEAPPPVAARRSVASWDVRMRRAEGHARRCMEKSGATIKPLVVTLTAGEPPSVRGVTSGSDASRCVREALERFGLEVSSGQRQHTFFAAP
jgi:serine/threonine protein kinase